METPSSYLRPFDLPLNPARLANAIKLRIEVPKGRLLLSEVEFENGMCAVIFYYNRFCTSGMFFMLFLR